RPLAPLRPLAHRPDQAPATRWLAGDSALGPDHGEGRVTSSENNDRSTVPDDALRYFPPLDRHRPTTVRRLQGAHIRRAARSARLEPSVQVRAVVEDSPPLHELRPRPVAPLIRQCLHG